MNFKRCSKGVWDSTIPGIRFNEKGESNYYDMLMEYRRQYPRGEKGNKEWKEYVSNIKKSGKGKRYDCIIGVSGGTDSSYLMHLAKEVYGLRPLAVNLDNGWSSDISVKNIAKITKALEIDLETYVIDYEEIKDILISYIKAGMPWIDIPTDLAIKSVLYKIAKREKLKHILIGHDFRSEGSQPNEWSNGDAKQLKYIQKKFGTKKIKTFPNMSLFSHFWFSYVRKIKTLYPFFFIEYNKQDAQNFLIDNYNWEYYGGHHHENIFTKFAISNWMPNKFGMEKRIITYSAQIIDGKMTREEAIQKLKTPPVTVDEMEKDRLYVIKKLGMSEDEYKKYWNNSNKSFLDYPSYHGFLEKIFKLIMPFIKYILPQMPAYFIQLENRNKYEKK